MHDRAASAAKGAIRALARFTGKSAAAHEPERCELCANALAQTHAHVVEPKARALACVCGACAILFPSSDAPVHDHAAQRARYVRLVTGKRVLPRATLDERDWSMLGVPVRLAFLCPSRAHDALFIIYPSPGGPVETRAPLSSWDALIECNPDLTDFALDCEAWIVDTRFASRGVQRPSVRVTLDLAYELLGSVRAPSSHAPHGFAELEAKLARLQSEGAPHA